MARNKAKAYVVLVAALLFNSKAPAQQPAASPKSTGAITGRVVNSNGEALPGAIVSAVSVAVGTPRLQGTTADSNGDFKLDSLEPGLYRVSTGLPGYVPSALTRPNDPTTYYRIGDSVTLTLMKGGVITGTVTGPNGPMVSVGVFATRVRDGQGKKLPSTFGSGERQTDDRGIFRIYGLAPGAYLIAAAKPRVGRVAPSAYDYDAPTYFPSATRDTATEIVVREADEITADIQYRAEPGYALSGNIAGAVEAQTSFASSALINLTDVRTRTTVASVGTVSTDGHTFAIYGIPAGEYELSAAQFLQTREELRSRPRRVTVRGADVTGISLTLAPQASIEGHVVFENDPRATCAKRRDTVAQETMVYARRYEPEKKTADPRAASPEVSVSAVTYSTFSVGDAKGSLVFRNLPPGSYRIDPSSPASGWYLRSIVLGTQSGAATTFTTARDGIKVKGGDRVTGLLVTFTEGASRLRGRVTAAEGQTLPPRMIVYLVPAEREAADNVLRFYEAQPEADRSFTINHLSPGKYLVLARPLEEDELGASKLIRSNSNFRATIFQEAVAGKKEISFKPCEQAADYELLYSPIPNH